MPSVSLRDLGLGRRLTGVSLDIAAGEHLLVAGPSGAGKTTLLRLVAGLETPTAGSIAFAGRDVTAEPPHRRGVALVAQRPALYSHLTVRRNLGVGVELRRRFWSKPPVQLADRVGEAAELLGLTPLLDRRPDQLSGGEQQRVALGRAWVSRAAVWLLDEPFGHLDPALRQQVRDRTLALRAQAGATVIEVTHDPAEGRGHDGRVAVLCGGRLDQVGSAGELYAHPATRAVAEALADVPVNVTADGALVRPESVYQSATSARDGLDQPAAPARDELVGDWRVVRVAPRGPAFLVTVERDGLVWRIWRADAPAVGTTLTLAVASSSRMRFRE